jgi:polyphosphate kinase 2 (PPK2 family)
MKSKDFIVGKRPKLAALTNHPRITFADYERRLQSMQTTMQSIQQAYLGTKERAVVVLEGWDTAGKGGIVRRLGWALDPRSFKVFPIAAPLHHEQGRHYLQRFWEKLPGPGQIVVFDRSWYGRVLVERVENLASKPEWKRAYKEINQFEQMMVDDGIRLVKCFLHITPAEQIRRFRDRLTNPLKRWKLSYEDFRNRARWADYEIAIEDMLEKTSVVKAPWHLVPTNDKLYGAARGVHHHGRHFGQGPASKTAAARSQSGRIGQEADQPEIKTRQAARPPSRQGEDLGSVAGAIRLTRARCARRLATL